MSCCLVIAYPHKSFGSCCDKALTFRWAIMGWPIDWLCVTLTLPLYHTHGICLYLLFIAFSLEFVSLPKKKKILLLLLLNICKLSYRFGYKCPHLRASPPGWVPGRWTALQVSHYHGRQAQTSTRCCYLVNGPRCGHSTRVGWTFSPRVPSFLRQCHRLDFLSLDLFYYRRLLVAWALFCLIID